jgi:hypothetical protein
MISKLSKLNLKIDEKNIAKFSLRYSLILAAIGTSLMIPIFCFGRGAFNAFGMFGAVFLLFSFVGAVLILLYAVILFAQRKLSVFSMLKIAISVLVAILIGFSCLPLGFYLNRTTRLILINRSDEKIDKVMIECIENKIIGGMDIDEWKFVTIPLMGDCSVKLNYRLKGKDISETLYGYAESASGENLIFRIGKDTSRYLE